MGRIVLFIIISVANSFFADGQHTLRRLHVGDSVPDVQFNSTRNYPGGTNKRLSDFKNKYIILDFWDKTCSSCIAGMPKMEELQKKYNNDVQIMLVTKNNEAELSNLFRNSPILKNIKLPIILADSLLSRVMFPADNGLPHHVWLDKNWQVLAITSGSEATPGNIVKMLNGEQLNLTSLDALLNCDDISGEQQSLLSFNKGMFTKYLCYFSSFNSSVNEATDFNKAISGKISYSAFARRIDICNRQRHSIYYKNAGKMVGRLLYNVRLESMLRIAFSFVGAYSQKIMPEPGVRYEPMPVDDPKRSRWYFDNLYCYEMFSPDFTETKFSEQLREDIEKYLGFTGVIEDRSIKCLILYRTTKEDRLVRPNKNDPEFFEITHSKQGIIISNSAFGKLRESLHVAYRSGEDPQFLDETGIDRSTLINMNLHVNDFRDIPGLQKELAKYGLGLKEETRTMKVLVLKTINN